MRKIVKVAVSGMLSSLLFLPILTTVSYAENINNQYINHAPQCRPYYPPNFPRPNPYRPYRPYPIYPPRPIPMYRSNHNNISRNEVLGAALLLILMQTAANNNANQNQINAGGNK